MELSLSLCRTALIDHLLTHETAPRPNVLFFLCRFDEPQSLKADTILRSILRQILDPANLSKKFETLFPDPARTKAADVDLLTTALVEQVRDYESLYLCVDGLDECEPSERKSVFAALVQILRANSTARVFVSSRDSIQTEVEKHFDAVTRIALESSLIWPDLSRYIDGVLQQKLQDEELIVGNPALVEEIKTALCHGADGM